MADLTDTQTAVDIPEARGERSVVGLVAVFSGDRPVLVAHPVERRSRIGRDREMEICTDDIKTSRLHAEVLPAPDGVLVSDMNSRNGTYLDCERITSSQTPAAIGSTLRLGRTVFRVVSNVKLYAEYRADDDDLVGGPALMSVRRTIRTIAPSRAPVLIEGETGTGKELVAGALHRASGRTGDLVAVNCAALPGDLVESELFGHAKGAFSSSDRPRRGLFRTADGGTLLLDEIGDLPLAAQAKLLRVLESSEVRAVGEDRPTTIDVRVVAATNKDLDVMVKSGAFRSDLYHRIASSTLWLPPLRDRLEDLPALAMHFLQDEGVALGVRAIERLMTYSWPGNVRELRNVILSAATQAKARSSLLIDADDVKLRESSVDANGGDESLRASLIAALGQHKGNVSQAARELGMRRPQVYEVLRRLGLDPERFRK
jgi:transcriptional regulator with GAF, ATPase, and Fis domain